MLKRSWVAYECLGGEKKYYHVLRWILLKKHYVSTCRRRMVDSPECLNPNLNPRKVMNVARFPRSGQAVRQFHHTFTAKLTCVEHDSYESTDIHY